MSTRFRASTDAGTSIPILFGPGGRKRPHHQRPPRSKSKSQSLVIVRGMPDFVDIAVSQSEHLVQKNWSSDICHPIVVLGLLTTIFYAIFITILITYMNVEGFRDFIHSLKRLANIKEWFRIIFKPWQTDGNPRNDDNSESSTKELKPRDSDLDPEIDVKIID